MSAAHHVWRVPVTLGMLSVAALAVGLLGDGVWDAIAVVALATPLLVGAWYAVRPVRRR